jgi:hypothetical protein
MKRINISTSRALLSTFCNTMQSTGSRPDSPNPEQDTLLRPLNSASPAVTDEMPIAKKIGDDRGMMDNIGLGLVYVRRISLHKLELIYVGRLWGTCTAHIHFGADWELCCTSNVFHKRVC